jgi:Gram-negative bacterial TonB protein C-terminal
MTIRLNTCIFLTLACVVPIQAQNAPTAQQLLDTAHRQANLSSVGPYKLTATFLVTPLDKKGRPNPKKQQQGTLTILRDHDRVRFEAQLGAERDTQFQIGDIRYIDSNGALLTMFSLVDFDQSWDPERPAKGQLHRQYTLSELSRKKINDADAWCLEKRDGEHKDELCFGVEHSELLKAKPYTFAGYQKAGDLQFPGQVEIERTEMPPIKVTDISLTPQALAPDTFQVPEKMIAIESCEDRKPARAVFTPEPDFTDAARKHKGGFVLLNLIIDMDGKVIGAHALTQDPYGLAQGSTNKVKTWKFEPASCGGHPVNVEMKVEVAFNMY